MKEILFVTTNSGKVSTLSRLLPADRFKVIQQPFHLPEIQGNTAVEISQEKAKTAYLKFKRPLIIQDSSFHINALNGFPGPYIKYVQETIGLAGLLKLLENEKDRSAYFEQAVTYIDESSTNTFVCDKKNGVVSSEIDSSNSSTAWGIIWKIFIPDGYDKTLSAMSDQELKALDNHDSATSEFVSFANWFILQNLRD